MNDRLHDMEIERKRRKSPRIITNRLRSEMIPDFRVKNFCPKTFLVNLGAMGGDTRRKKVSRAERSQSERTL